MTDSGDLFTEYDPYSPDLIIRKKGTIHILDMEVVTPVNDAYNIAIQDDREDQVGQWAPDIQRQRKKRAITAFDVTRHINRQNTKLDNLEQSLNDTREAVTDHMGQTFKVVNKLKGAVDSFLKKSTQIFEDVIEAIQQNTVAIVDLQGSNSGGLFSFLRSKRSVDNATAETANDDERMAEMEARLEHYGNIAKVNAAQLHNVTETVDQTRATLFLLTETVERVLNSNNEQFEALREFVLSQNKYRATRPHLLNLFGGLLRKKRSILDDMTQPPPPIRPVRRQEFNQLQLQLNNFSTRILQAMQTINENFHQLTAYNSRLQWRHDNLHAWITTLAKYIDESGQRVRRAVDQINPADTMTSFVSHDEFFQLRNAFHTIRDNIAQTLTDVNTYLVNFANNANTTDQVSRIIMQGMQPARQERDLPPINDTWPAQRDYDYTEESISLINDMVNRTMLFGDTYNQDYANIRFDAMANWTPMNIFEAFKASMQRYMDWSTQRLDKLTHNVAELTAVSDPTKMVQLLQQAMTADMEKQVDLLTSLNADRKRRSHRDDVLHDLKMEQWTNQWRRNEDSTDGNVRVVLQRALASALAIPNSPTSTTDEEYQQMDQMLTKFQTAGLLDNFAALQDSNNEDEDEEDEVDERRNVFIINNNIIPMYQDMVSAFAQVFNITASLFAPMQIIQGIANLNVTKELVREVVQEYVETAERDRVRRSVTGGRVSTSNPYHFNSLSSQLHDCKEKTAELTENINGYIGWARTVARQIEDASVQPTFQDLHPHEYPMFFNIPEFETPSNYPIHFVEGPFDPYFAHRSKRDLATQQSEVGREKRAIFTLILTIIGVLAAITVPAAVQIGVDVYLTAQNEKRISKRQASNYSAIETLMLKIEEITATQIELYKQINLITTLLSRNGFEARSATQISEDIARGQFDLKDRKMRARMIAVMDRARRNQDVKGLIKQWTDKTTKQKRSANKDPRLYNIEELLKYPLTPQQVALHRKYLKLTTAMNGTPQQQEQLNQMRDIHLRVMKALTKFAYDNKGAKQEQTSTFKLPFIVAAVLGGLVCVVAFVLTYIVCTRRPQWTPVPVNP